jgi:hypothetical protein
LNSYLSNQYFDLFYKDGVLIETYISFTIIDNVVSLDLDTLTNGEYRVEIEGFDSIFGETLPLFFWNFTVIA